MSTNDLTSAADQHTVRFAAADPAAIREAYQTYGQLVYAVAHRILGDVVLAEDAVEQTFLRAWREAGTDGLTRPLGSRIASIARRVALDLLERAADTVPPSRDVLDDVWEVRQAIHRLPIEDRELLRLQHHRKLTEAEIATKLSIPPATVAARNIRAHRRLAGLLGQLRVANPRHTPPVEWCGSG